MDLLYINMNTCFVDDINKLCFINIPKNASTTIRTTLHLKNSEYTEEYKDYHKIIVIRNPMTRIISSYNEVIKLRRDGPYKQTVKTKFYHYYKVRHDVEKSFDLFLDYIKNNMYNEHVFHQHSFIESKGLTINDFEHIILFENLEKELKNIIQLYNINSNKINHLQSGHNRNKKKIRSFIRKYANKIRSIYSDDFELYKKIKEM